MPDSLEYFVRPFQSPDAHGRGVIASTPRGTRERATLTWGAKADMKDVDVAERDGTELICCQQDHKETYRTGATREIAASSKPEMPSGYGTFPDYKLWVHTPASVTLQKKEKQSCLGGWEQMSGVASAVKELFADLAEDIKAGRGDDKEPCKVTYNFADA